MADEPLRPDIELAGDAVMRVRLARPDDVDGLVAMYAAMSLEDRYHRFFSAFIPSASFFEAWLQVAERGGAVIVAEVLDGDRREIVADAGYSPLANGNGELAIAVAPGRRGWLGVYLLDVLCELAAEREVANLEADVLLDNTGMLALVGSRGAATIEHPDRGIVRLLIPTVGHTPSWPRHHDRPRVLVEVKGGRWAGEEEARAANVDVVVCPGPSRQRRGECPVLRGEACPLARDADAIVFGLEPDEPRNRAIREGHGALHPDVPVIDRTARAAERPRACSPAVEVAAVVDALTRRRGAPDTPPSDGST